MDLAAKRIVVTGGSGFLGSHLVENLRRGTPTNR
jgi:nucleoside-diphosphate-sugar epimerase